MKSHGVSCRATADVHTRRTEGPEHGVNAPQPQELSSAPVVERDTAQQGEL